MPDFIAEIVANTRERLRAYPDFHGVIDETIWTRDEHGVRTSICWTWTGMNTGAGASPLGPATGRGCG